LRQAFVIENLRVFNFTYL